MDGVVRLFERDIASVENLAVVHIIDVVNRTDMIGLPDDYVQNIARPDIKAARVVWIEEVLRIEPLW